MTLTAPGRVGPTGAFSLGNHLAKRRLPIILRQIAELIKLKFTSLINIFLILRPFWIFSSYVQCDNCPIVKYFLQFNFYHCIVFKKLAITRGYFRHVTSKSADKIEITVEDCFESLEAQKADQSILKYQEHRLTFLYSLK